MVIAHNISAINTYKSMGIASTATNKSMEKLSSGYRINRAGDDAAGLSISEKMRSQIRGLNQASRNAQDGISMIQTAEGALNESHSILQRMRELAVQSATDTNAEVDREALQNEISQLTSEINRIGNTTEFNGMKLLDGSKSSTTVVEEGTQISVAKQGSLTFSQALGVTSSGAGIKLENGGVKIGTSTDGIKFDQLQGADNANTIKISENATGDGFTVDIKLTEAKAASGSTADDPTNNTLTVDSEAMIKNEDGSYSYDNHGISFKISATEAASIFDNEHTDDGITIDLFKASGSPTDTAVNAKDRIFGVTNDYTTDGINVKVNDFKLSEFGSNDRLDFASVRVEYTSGAAATNTATLTVTYYSDAAGTDAILVDTITQNTVLTASTSDTPLMKYDANGLSFKLDKYNTVGSDDMEILINLDEKLGTENAMAGATYKDNSAYFHVGANENQAINMSFGDMRAAALGIVGTGEGYVANANVASGLTNDATEKSLDISTRTGANSAIGVIDDAIQKVSEERSKYGAVQNRIEYTINNLNTTSENLQSAESRIRDVDMASEMMEMTKNNILQQASQAMLSQAMQTPQQALQLLQG